MSLYNLCIIFCCVIPDKDQDGDFKWVDKSPIQFSNYGPGWPRNTANFWDCGQIFTGRINSDIFISSRLRLASAQFMFSSRKL